VPPCFVAGERRDEGGRCRCASMRHLRHHAPPARTDGREWDGGTGRDKVVDFCFSVPWAEAGPCRSRKGRCAVDCAGLLAFKAHLDLLNFLIDRWVKYHVKYKLPIYVQNQIFTFFKCID
jgi:hypothetical protein